MNRVPLLLKKFFKGLFSRALGLYLLAFLVLAPFTNFSAALIQARSSALSRFVPNFGYLLDFRDQQVPLDKEKMQIYFDYFRKVDAYLPDKADVMSLVGYCAYYLGRDNEALLYYRRAIMSYAVPLAAHYNLGALYFKKGDYRKAIESIRRALTSDFVKNISFISSSRIYFPIIKNPRKIDEELTEYMRTGYERCYRLLVASYAALNDPTNELFFAIQALGNPVADPSFFHYHAGVASSKLKEFKPAVNFLTAYLKQHPKNPAALRNLGATLQEMGQNNLAAGMFAQVEQLEKRGIKGGPELKIELQLY